MNRRTTIRKQEYVTGYPMSKLVDLDQFRTEQTAKRGFAGWHKRYGDPFSPETRLTHLSNIIIRELAEPGEDSATIYYELIMGTFNLGSVHKFEFLNPKDRLHISDVHLFLTDLVRYEMMFRIQWISGYTCQDRSLMDLVVNFDPSDYSRYSNPPQLSRCHPQFDAFAKRIAREKEVMLRQLHREALAKFNATFSF